MNYLFFSNLLRRGMQVALLIAILLLNFGMAGPAYAAAPTNNTFAGATIFTTIPYTSAINTLEATADVTDPQVNASCDGKLLAKGKATVWYRYTPATTGPLSLDTIGSDYDTYLAIWTGNANNLTYVACDDDNNAGFQSQLAFIAFAGVTYYIEVAEYNGTQPAPAPSSKPEPDLAAQASNGGSLVFHAKRGANVEVWVSGQLKGDYLIPAQSNQKASYTNLNNGPVRVQSLQNVPVVASERVAYFDSGLGKWTSFSELMGLPISQVTNSYLFPWYNNVDLNSQLRFGNVGTAATTVTVIIGGVARGTYNLGINQSTRVSYAGLNSGPIRVISSNGVPIIASLRVAYFDGSVWKSFSEMMGLPASKVTTNYTFPWYNNVDINSQLRFGNVGTASTTITVTIGGIPRGSYTLAPNQSTRVSYSGLNSGPIRVTSSGNVPIIASERVAYYNGSIWTNFAELMGMPTSSLSTHYSFPVYNNADLNTQLRFGNVGAANTIVTVTIGGAIQGTYNLAPNQSTRVSFVGVNNGPVVVQSSGNVPIIASERVAYLDTGLGKWTSFTEMMGLPLAQLTTSYLFPWYNNVDLNTQVRFGVP